MADGDIDRWEHFVVRRRKVVEKEDANVDVWFSIVMSHILQKSHTVDCKTFGARELVAADLFFEIRKMALGLCTPI